MDEYKIRENIIIDAPDEVVNRLKYHSGIRNIDINSIKNFIIKEKNTLFFFNNKMKRTEENDNDTLYLWMDSGITDKKGKPLFISLLKLNWDSEFVGHFIGTSQSLKQTICNYNQKHKTIINTNAQTFDRKYHVRASARSRYNLMEELESQKTNENKNKPSTNPDPISEIGKLIKETGYKPEKTEEKKEQQTTQKTEINENKPIVDKSPSKDSIAHNIYTRLMINNWNSENGLARYIKIIGVRLITLIKEKREEYYVCNKLGHAVINTGLLNNFGLDIMLMYRKNLKYNIYEAYRIIESRRDYIEEAFTKEQSIQEIKPIKFTESNEFFDGKMIDFDINYRDLLHIIQERKERFPEQIQGLQESVLANRIVNALEIGLKMQDRDESFIRPSYSTKLNKITWFMPLHIFSNLAEPPELLLVINQKDEFYEIKTILPYNGENIDRMRCLSLYGKIW